MKKYKSSLLIFIIISLSLCGCSNQEVSNLCDVYEGETVDLSEIYSKNKDEATRLFNFYYNYGKHVESKDYKNYNCYTYDNTPAQSRPTFPYRNMVDIVFGNASYFLASDYSSLNSANYYYDSSNKILKFESSSNTVNYMYKDISSTEYYCYSLGNQNGNYTFDKYKDYIKNGKLYKRELIKSTKISLEEYEKEFEKFNKYFEKNKM